jgi:outer membrane protein assembly factor BamB
VQPVALAVRTFGTQAYFADRKGLVVCVDLQKKEAVWSRSAAGSAGIFQDLECGKEGVFAYAKGSIHGFARENGTPLFGPLSGVTCPPLLHDRMLYFGNDKGEFVVAEAATGKIVKRLGVDAHIVSRPEWTAGKVVACAASGEILVLRPEAIQ